MEMLNPAFKSVIQYGQSPTSSARKEINLEELNSMFASGRTEEAFFKGKSAKDLQDFSFGLVMLQANNSPENKELVLPIISKVGKFILTQFPQKRASSSTRSLGAAAARTHSRRSAPASIKSGPTGRTERLQERIDRRMGNAKILAARSDYTLSVRDLRVIRHRAGINTEKVFMDWLEGIITIASSSKK